MNLYDTHDEAEQALKNATEPYFNEVNFLIIKKDNKYHPLISIQLSCNINYPKLETQGFPITPAWME